MENGVLKIKMFINECLLAYISVFLKTTNNERHASLTITQKGPHEMNIVSLTSADLNDLLQKIEDSKFDGTIRFEDWFAPPTIPSKEMKLLKYDDRGEFFSLEFNQHRVTIDNDIILTLLYAEERIHAFLTAED